MHSSLPLLEYQDPANSAGLNVMLKATGSVFSLSTLLLSSPAQGVGCLSQTEGIRASLWTRPMGGISSARRDWRTFPSMKLDSIANRLVTTFGGRETEQNWEKVDSLLKEYTLEVTLGASIEDILTNTKRCKEVIQDTLTTERTRLALTSLATVIAIANRLQSHYEHLQETFLYPILKLCERANKLLSERAKSTLLDVLKACPAPSKIIFAKLQEGQSSANKSLRQSICEALHVMLKSLNRDSSEYLDVLQKMLFNGLQDAAEPVRAVCRKTFTSFAEIFPEESVSFSASLPLPVLKSLQKCETSCIPKPTFRSFLASNRQEVPKMGPQRVTSKPLTTNPAFHPYSTSTTTNGGGLEANAKKISRSTDQMRAPSRISRPPGVVAHLGPPNVATPTCQRPTRIPTSASMGNLSTESSGATRPAAAVVMPSPGLTRLTSSTALYATAEKPKASQSSIRASLSISSVFDEGTTPSPRSILAEFKSQVAHPDWTNRQRALQDFLVSLKLSKVIEYIAKSQTKTLAIFDIFAKGVKDAHHQVVAASLDLGRSLFETFPSSGHTSLVKFSASLMFQLHAILTNIQFKARSDMLEKCRLLIGLAADWLNSPTIHLQSLFGAIQIHDHLDKTRIPILQTIVDTISKHERSLFEPVAAREIGEFIRRNGAWFYDKDLNLVSAMNQLVFAASTIIPASDLLQYIPTNSRSTWSKRLESHYQPETVINPDSPQLEVNPIIPLHSSIKDYPDLPSGSPMRDVDRGIAANGNVRRMVTNEHVVILDEELGISLRLRHQSDPSTPLKPIVVDFETPRSMDHHADQLDGEGHSSSGEELIEEDASSNNEADDIIKQYTTTSEAQVLVGDAGTTAIERLDLS